MGTGVVFAVAGSKGGVGKTTTSINLCAVLADLGHDVVLVEMDLAMANVGDFLDIDVHLEGEDPTLHEVLGGTVSVVDATYDSPCGFDVVPSGASLQGFVNANVDAVSGALATLRFAYDVVVLDTGAGVMPSTLVSLALADETILISSPRVASVRDTKKTRDITRQVGGNVAGVVFVKSGTGRSPGVDRIAEFLSVDLLGHVPKDNAVASAQDVGQPVVVTRPESDAATAYRALGDSIHERINALDSAQPTALSDDGADGDDIGFAFVDTDEPVDEGDAEDDVVRDDAEELVEDDQEQVEETPEGTLEGTLEEESEADVETEAEVDVETETGVDVEKEGEDEAEERTEPNNAGERFEYGVEETSPTAPSCDASGTAERREDTTGNSSSPTPPAENGQEVEPRAVAKDGGERVPKVSSTDAEDESVATEPRPPEPVSAGPTGATETLGDGSVHTGDEDIEGESREGTAGDDIEGESRESTGDEDVEGESRERADPESSVTKRLLDRAKGLVDRDDD